MSVKAKDVFRLAILAVDECFGLGVAVRGDRASSIEVECDARG